MLLSNWPKPVNRVIKSLMQPSLIHYQNHSKDTDVTDKIIIENTHTINDQSYSVKKALKKEAMQNRMAQNQQQVPQMVQMVAPYYQPYGYPAQQPYGYAAYGAPQAQAAQGSA